MKTANVPGRGHRGTADPRAGALRAFRGILLAMAIGAGLWAVLVLLVLF